VNRAIDEINRRLRLRTAVGLRALQLRRLVEERHGGFALVPAEVDVLRYHANSIRHLLPQEV